VRTENDLDIENIYELSPLQHGMLLHTLLEPHSGIFVEHFGFRFDGPLQPDTLGAAWQMILRRHMALRTTFHWENLEKPVQVVHGHAELFARDLDWRDMPAAEQERRLAAYVAEDREQGFDLSTVPLLRVATIRLGETRWHYLWTFHHLLLDGWSAQIVNAELHAVYEALAAGREPGLPPVRPYTDYIAWLQRQDTSAARDFWQRNLAGFTAATPLTMARHQPGASRDADQSAYANMTLYWPASLTDKLRTFGRRYRLTLSTLFQGAWSIFLGRSAGVDDVVFGALVSGRPADLPGVESIVGLFINILPVRSLMPPDATAIEFLLNLQAGQVRSREFEYSALMDIQGWCDVPRGQPLFDSMLVFENLPGTQLAAGDPSNDRDGAAASPVGFQQSNFPLNLLVGVGARVWLKFLFDSRVFDRGTIERIAGQLRLILYNIASNPSCRLSELPLIGETERHKLLVEWNDTRRDYDYGFSLSRRFEAQARRTPDGVAFLHGDQSLTYGLLNRKANRLAHHLRRSGIGPETLVGVCLERSFDAAIALLAVIKAGGAFLPLDPTYPMARLSLMLEDVPVRTIVTCRRLAGLLPATEASVICLDTDAAQMADCPDDDPASAAEAGHLAYVIFTSGSTGRPKGIAVEHRQLINRLSWMWDRYPFAPGEVACQKTALSFVDSLWELLGPLLQGIPTVILSQAVTQDAGELVRALAEHRVSRLWLVPSQLRAILDSHHDLPLRLPALRFWVTTGEALTMDLARRFAAALPHATLHNLFGTSEVWDATWNDPGAAREPEDLVPIGRPISNVRVYVLDGALRPVPVGVPGELHVGGAGLARGYVNRPELTADRFPPDPFADEPGARMYRTGDRARYRADGALEYLGRADHQAKIRGYRIEPMEIESLLIGHPGVRQAAVVACGGEDEPRLAAYVVPAGASPPGAAELRNFLQARLPAWMVPATFVMLSELPLTPSGKLDRAALPAHGRRDLPGATELAPPQTPTEKAIARIWQDLMGLGEVGRNDHFFECGGHSLLATRLASRIRQDLGVEIPLRLIFDAPVLERLADGVETLRWAALQTNGAAIGADAGGDASEPGAADGADAVEKGRF
jgi:surfactin family lipopeptide synthetase C